MRKLVSDEKLKNAVVKVISSRFKVDSQTELRRLVMKQLRKDDKNYSVSPIRLKKIALGIPQISVKAKTRKTPKVQKLKYCPICESKIKPMEMKNLLNKKVVVGYHCTQCNYQSDLEAFMPMKYSFVWKQN